ncbi:MAG: GreA/GreB family elongation factor [Eubacteriales bacterium]|jgi:regulator of nucleoside diphosphate kinase|nr:GreA/GreB family elongation factor [Eubacteriales bacterium]MDD3290527.1 GreA/GreB family elongation factor [Eubacteriales bacterium]MDD3864292.1 GreA/GreB family elongation factor [Eubacteriales bacterium]
MAETIFITSNDKKKLLELLTTQISSAEALGPHVRKLENEINKASVIQPDQATPDLITMNSRVLLQLDDTEMDLWLVYPKEADVNENKVSILSPIGTAILGYSKGDTIQWEVPSGFTRIVIKEILYQPESAWEDDAIDMIQ